MNLKKEQLERQWLPVTAADIDRAVGEMKGALIEEIVTAQARMMRLVAIMGLLMLLMLGALAFSCPGSANHATDPSFAPGALTPSAGDRLESDVVHP